MLNFQVLFILSAGNTDINKLKLNDLLQMIKREKKSWKVQDVLVKCEWLKAHLFKHLTCQRGQLKQISLLYNKKQLNHSRIQFTQHLSKNCFKEKL